VGGLTVSGVSGNTITAMGRASNHHHHVTSTTKYTEAGTAISLTDIKVGSQIAVHGTRASATATDGDWLPALRLCCPGRTVSSPP